MSWQRACTDFAEEQGLDGRWLRVLHAFGGWAPEQRGPAFEELEGPVEGLAQRVAQDLAAEVDAAQASMFARRLEAVHRLLRHLARPEARLLRVGLLSRVRDILQAPPPHALRVRACVDFYFSQAALLKHEDPSAPSIEQLAETLTWSAVAEGLEHALLEGNSRWGPLHVNLLRVHAGRSLRCVDLRGRPGRFAEQVAAEGALAAVSGGFFLYSEPDIVPPSQRGDPVGWLVQDGRCVHPPALRRTALRVDDAGWRFERCSLEGWTFHGHRVAGVNRPELLGRELVAFNRAFAGRVDWPHTLQLVGASLHEGSTVPLNGALLAFPSGPPDPGPVELPGGGQAMAGGPVLLREGELCLDLEREDFAGTAPPITFSKDETYDQNLLPRMASGLDQRGRLLFAAVDGRNLDRAPGLTLGKTALLLRALGCTEAMNLDGGSSKRMVVLGRVVDLPSTEVVAGQGDRDKVRPVRTAILVH